MNGHIVLEKPDLELIKKRNAQEKHEEDTRLESLEKGGVRR